MTTFTAEATSVWWKLRNLLAEAFQLVAENPDLPGGCWGEDAPDHVRLILGTICLLRDEHRLEAFWPHNEDAFGFISANDQGEESYRIIFAGDPEEISEGPVQVHHTCSPGELCFLAIKVRDALASRPMFPRDWRAVQIGAEHRNEHFDMIFMGTYADVDEMEWELMQREVDKEQVMSAFK